MAIGKIVVWLIVSALAGTLAGRVMTFSKRGFGFWTNMGIGMVGALVGGFLFWLFHIDLHLAVIKITNETGSRRGNSRAQPTINSSASSSRSLS
jgi:uncharacterized membrane protein YeaQ/YmgE (transglycosylase-associated protein family)